MADHSNTILVHCPRCGAHKRESVCAVVQLETCPHCGQKVIFERADESLLGRICSRISSSTTSLAELATDKFASLQKNKAEQASAKATMTGINTNSPIVDTNFEPQYFFTAFQAAAGIGGTGLLILVISLVCIWINIDLVVYLGILGNNKIALSGILATVILFFVGFLTQSSQPIAIANSEHQTFFTSFRIAAGVGVTGMLILAISPFFKWINLGPINTLGINANGKIVLGVTLVAITLFIVSLSTHKLVGAVFLGINIWGIVVMLWMGGLIWSIGSISYSPANDKIERVISLLVATQVSPGSGLYLGLIGGIIVAIAFGFLAFWQFRSVGHLKLYCTLLSIVLVLGIIPAIHLVKNFQENKPEDTPSTATPILQAPDKTVVEKRETKDQELRRLNAEEIKQLWEKLRAEKRDILNKFTIERSIRKRSSIEFISEDCLEISVRNNTGRTVSRAYFHAILLTPGREMPWVEDEFIYPITGGLESGESATWNLSPNAFGTWGNAPRDRDDLVLIVRPVGLDGTDGVSFTGEPFTNQDAAQLRELLESPYHGDVSKESKALKEREDAIRQWKELAVCAAVRLESGSLHNLKADSESTQALMAKFRIKESRFIFSKDRFSVDPVIELTARNNTDQTIFRFYCRGVLSSPGRDAPWVDETFNHSVRGGIQPGETQKFRLAPNMFGPWSKAPKDREDMTLSLTVYRLDGPDGQELYPSQWSEEHQKRLAALDRIIHEQGW